MFAVLQGRLNSPAKTGAIVVFPAHEDHPLTAGGGHQSEPDRPDTPTQKDAHGYPLGVLPLRQPSPVHPPSLGPDNHESSGDPQAGQAVRNRYPEAIRALIAGRGDEAPAEDHASADQGVVAPTERRGGRASAQAVDFLPTGVPRYDPTPMHVSIDTPTAEPSESGEFFGVIFAGIAAFFKLPVTLIRVLMPRAIDPEDTWQPATQESYPAPRWQPPAVRESYIAYDPNAAQRLVQQPPATHSPTLRAAQPGPSLLVPPMQPLPTITEPVSRVSAILPPMDMGPPANANEQHAALRNLIHTPTESEHTANEAHPSEADSRLKSTNTFVALARMIRRTIVWTLSAMFTILRWTPHILWCCTFGLVKSGIDILSEAAQTSGAPARKPRPAVSDPGASLVNTRETQTEALELPTPSTGPSGADVVSTLNPPTTDASAASRLEPESLPGDATDERTWTPAAEQGSASDITPETESITPDPANELAKLAAAAEAGSPPEPTPASVVDTPLQPVEESITEDAPQGDAPAPPAAAMTPPPVPPVPPVPPLTPITPADDVAPRSKEPLVLSPSSVRPAEGHEVFSAAPARVPGRVAGFFSAGLGNMLLMLLGSTALFAAGFGLSFVDKSQAVMASVMLMIAGVGGALMGVMLLNEWVNALRFQLVLPLRFVVRALGLCAAVCLLAAFAAVTIPREHWPI